MSILEAKEKWSQTFEKVYIHLRDDHKSSARQLCNDLLKEQEIHPFYEMKSHIMLAALADIPPVAEMHFKEADRICDQLYESKQANEGEEILTYREIIKSGLRDLGPEIREWKIEEGLYISSSDEDSETEDRTTTTQELEHTHTEL